MCFKTKTHIFFFNKMQTQKNPKKPEQRKLTLVNVSVTKICRTPKLQAPRGRLRT